MNYRKQQLDEILFLINKGFSYNEILSMPTFLRRYFIEYIMELSSK